MNPKLKLKLKLVECSSSLSNYGKSNNERTKSTSPNASKNFLLLPSTCSPSEDVVNVTSGLPPVVVVWLCWRMTLVTGVTVKVNFAKFHHHRVHSVLDYPEYCFQSVLWIIHSTYFLSFVDPFSRILHHPRHAYFFLIQDHRDLRDRAQIAPLSVVSTTAARCWLTESIWMVRFVRPKPFRYLIFRALILWVLPLCGSVFNADISIKRFFPRRTCGWGCPSYPSFFLESRELFLPNPPEYCFFFSQYCGSSTVPTSSHLWTHSLVFLSSSFFSYLLLPIFWFKTTFGSSADYTAVWRQDYRS
jgi:hypothetical protein